MVGSVGLRKGSWTEEEDNLLRKCIEVYGEGKWHRVPQVAGLNRCRKSCRLRWLNYLKPNIKRGDFAADEVDLMVRLHKLLGNRWSLIAGRLPGRTSNDVKNYWNTHVHKKTISKDKQKASPEIPKTVKHNVIRPRPRTLCKSSLPWLRQKVTIIENVQVQIRDTVNNPSPTVPDQALQNEDNTNWWQSFLDENEGNGGGTSFTNEIEEEPITSHRVEEIAPVVNKVEAGDIPVEVGQNRWIDDICFDADFWNIISDM